MGDSVSSSSGLLTLILIFKMMHRCWTKYDSGLYVYGWSGKIMKENTLKWAKIIIGYLSRLAHTSELYDSMTLSHSAFELFYNSVYCSKVIAVGMVPVHSTAN